MSWVPFPGGVDISPAHVAEVLQKVARRWRDVALKLPFTSPEKALLESDYRDQTDQECLSAIVNRWWEKEKEEVTWAKVVSMLMELGEEDMAKTLAEERGITLQTTPQYKSQKTEIQTALQQRLRKGDTWLVGKSGMARPL